MLPIIPLVLGGVALVTGGMFVGSQIDDAIDKNAQVIGGGITQQKMPIYITIPLVVIAGTAAFYITKKIIKKI